MWNWNLPVFVGLFSALIKYWQGWNKRDTVNSWCRWRIEYWASWLSLNVIACSLQWIWGVGVSTNQASCSSEPNRLVIMLIVCKAVLWSPSTVQRFRAMNQHPMAWPNQMFLLTLPVSEVFISFWRTNGSLCRCLGFYVKYFIVLTSRRKKKNTKNKCPVPHTDSSKSKGSHVLVVFYCLCDMKSSSVCILWNAFLHHASSMLLSLHPSCFQL